MSEVIDEQLSLKRLGVALKREDWRMFEQGLEKLVEEVEAGFAFQRHQEWQVFLKLASEHEALPVALKEGLREALTRLMSVEVSVPQARPAGLEEAEPVAIVVGWQSSLQDPRALAAFRAWLKPASARHGGDGAGRALIARWLDEPGVTLETLVNRANLTLAAAYGGVATSDPQWVDTLMAGLAHVLAQPLAAPPLTRLGEAIATHGQASVLTVEPSLVWERHYAEPFRRSGDVATGGLNLVKLAGSMDWFYCHQCFHMAEGAAGALAPLAVSCPRCASPAWPLLVPADNPHILPPAIRNVWAWGGELLREAGTWVLVEPPAPAEGSFQRWLAASLSGEKRVLVIGADEAVLAAWRSYLEESGVAATVTSRGPADDVLGFLLQGGVPELKAAPKAPVAAGGKKKRR